MKNLTVGTSKPREIRAALMMRGLTYKSIARELKVSSTLVWLVVNGKGTSARVREYIESVINGAPVN